jgi:hypothetical protein
MSERQRSSPAVTHRLILKSSRSSRLEGWLSKRRLHELSRSSRPLRGASVLGDRTASRSVHAFGAYA